MNPDNPVVQLCSRGMEEEALGRSERAAELFAEAWNVQRDDYDACIAAHYVARHQESQAERYKWNNEALRRAELVKDDRITDFYPSLYLNMGYSCEMIGNLGEARRFYEAVKQSMSTLAPGPYADMIGRGIARALARVNSVDCDTDSGSL